MQLATHLGRPDAIGIQAKLQILEAQSLISKRYGKSYRLAGRGAEYCLTPKGARALAEAVPDTEINENIMKSLYKNKMVSDAFLRHCIGIVDVVLNLQALHSEKLHLCTAPELRTYSYFPDWPPDLFLSYKASNGVTYRAFLDIWDSSKPFFVSVKKMRNHLTYAEEGDWPYGQSDYPALLAICPTKHDQKKLNPQMKNALSDSGDADEIPCGTTTIGQFNQVTKASEKIWLSVTWGDDPEPATLMQIIRKP